MVQTNPANELFVCNPLCRPQAGLKVPQSFVLLADGNPVGTASITDHDLEERPDLAPWPAGVFVVPDARGCGFAGQLVAEREQEARRVSALTLWLPTSTAKRLYARIDWQAIETVLHNSQSVTLMR